VRGEGRGKKKKKKKGSRGEIVISKWRTSANLALKLEGDPQRERGWKGTGEKHNGGFQKSRGMV